MQQEITRLFEKREEIPLFYVESGSRLWGIASPDSDYDVRGFHLQSKRQYYDFKKHRDLIEVMDGDFDFVSYGVDKMFGLLAKSNPTVFEWIRAHIVYFNQLPDWSHFQQDLVAHIDYSALYHHYISLAKGQINLMETGRRYTYKATFYCIRGLLSADLATQQVIPALLIDDLFAQYEHDNEVLKIAKDSLERKKQRAEKEEVGPQEQKIILAAIHQFMAQLKEKAPVKSNNRAQMESVLQDYGYRLKEQFYG